MRWRQTVGRDVVETTSASTLGSVEGLVVDVGNHRLSGVVMAGGIVPWSTFGSVGRDALTVPSAEVVEEPATDEELDAVAGRSDPIGRRVITEDGRLLGKVADVSFDPDTGTIRRLLLNDDDVDGGRLVGIGTYAVMVSSSGGRGGAPADLASLTREELYELAQEREVGGRSAMTKQELLDALS
jgi:sporulation protein YlmC with PRC-barrel domain